MLDPEKLELVTFYKKADIVKDQQSILAKFGQICKANACKIERKNACRVIELAKPELSRVWRLFCEALLASLTLRSPTGKSIPFNGTNIYLIPEVEAVLKDRAIRTNCETTYHLRRADLQIITGGYLLLAMRDSTWPPVFALTDMLDSNGSWWEKPSQGSIVYLLPTGQIARYNGGWIGVEDEILPWDAYPEDYDRDELRHRVCWFEKVKSWLEWRDYELPYTEEDRVWCTFEIPVVEKSDENGADQKRVAWKSIMWPAELAYIFLDERGKVSTEEIVDTTSDPLAAAQSWFSQEFTDLQTVANREGASSGNELSMIDGVLFDDDPLFGSPQQFMNNATQMSLNSQMIYPTPPEAMHPQNTPGVSMDGTAQTPMSAHPTQPSIYQSSPLATTADADTSHPHDSAISNFLQHDNDDLFEDEEGQKLVQPTFGDEPNWDFFDRDTTTPDLKPGLEFDDLNGIPPAIKSPEVEVDPHSQPLHLSSVLADSTIRSPHQTESTHLIASEQPLDKSGAEDPVTDSAGMTGQSNPTDIFPTEIKDFALFESVVLPRSPSAKRRRSSAYDVSMHMHKGHEHKYAVLGKYHFELRKPSMTSQDRYAAEKRGRHSTSASVSSASSGSDDTSEHRDTTDAQSKLWTRYEPDLEIDEPETVWDEPYDETVYYDEVEALAKVIGLAPGTEPFTFPLPLRRNTIRTKNHVLMNGERSFMIAQILAEQLTQSSVFRYDEALQLPQTKSSPSFDVFVDNSELGSSISNASLGDLASIQPPNSSSKPTAHTIALESDRVRLKQGDTEISAELPILRYWETVNLQPLSGPKAVRALCLHPEGGNFVQGCGSLLSRMKETYISCNLGTHESFSSNVLTDTGLLAWGLTSGKTTLSSLCRSVGKALASKSNKECMIIYIVMPGDNLNHSIEACDAFLDLFEALGRINHSPENDVVLQLIPRSFVVEPDNLIVHPEKRYVDLALEVYSRTPSIDAQSVSDTAGAVILEKSAGRSLSFELNSKMSSSSFRSGNCYHLAYCISSDRRWLVASWSDTIGRTAFTMPYRLINGEDGSRRPRIDVFKHICETTVHLVGREKGKAWLALAKIGIYETEELQDWLYLTQKLSEEDKSISRIVLLNVELQSRLSLHGLQTALKQGSIPLQPGMNNLSTPATTPQALITSPEQAVMASTTTSTANPQTPPDLSTDPGAETDIYLSNPADEAWATTLGFGLNQTHNFMEIRPAMASGLLLKRVCRPDSAAGVAITNVNLVAVPRKSNTAVTFAEREQMLQDMLVQYRGLHVLAIVRGCVSDTDGCIPWHVATAYKGARVLESLM